MQELELLSRCWSRPPSWGAAAAPIQSWLWGRLLELRPKFGLLLEVFRRVPALQRLEALSRNPAAGAAPPEVRAAET